MAASPNDQSLIAHWSLAFDLKDHTGTDYVSESRGVGLGAVEPVADPLSFPHCCLVCSGGLR